jgi:hypothetical protein
VRGRSPGAAFLAAVGAAALAASSVAAQAPPAGTVPLHAVLYETETLRSGPLPAELLQKMGPIHSLQGVEDLLKQNRVPFAWTRAQVNSATLPPDLAKQIEALPPGEVFVLKQGEGWVMAVVTGKH